MIMKKAQQGFTFIELIVTLAVVSILAMVAIPNFTSMIRDNRMVAQINSFVSSLNIGRSEAVRRGVTVTVCRSTNGTACVNSGNWNQGWLVFTDPDVDGVIDAGEEVIQVQEALTGNTLTGGNQISFNSRGFARFGANDFTGTFMLCAPNYSAGKGIVISVTGRPNKPPAALICP